MNAYGTVPTSNMSNYSNKNYVALNLTPKDYKRANVSPDEFELGELTRPKTIESKFVEIKEKTGSIKRVKFEELKYDHDQLF